MIFDLLLNSHPLLLMVANIMNNGVEWAVILHTGYTSPRPIRRLLKKHSIASWGFFTTHEKWEGGVSQGPEEERSEHFLTRDELLAAHPALSSDWGEARDEARMQNDYDEAHAPPEDQDVFLTVFYTRKGDAKRAFKIMKKQGFQFYIVPKVVWEGGK